MSSVSLSSKQLPGGWPQAGPEAGRHFDIRQSMSGGKYDRKHEVGVQTGRQAGMIMVLQ